MEHQPFKPLSSTDQIHDNILVYFRDINILDISVVDSEGTYISTQRCIKLRNRETTVLDLNGPMNMKHYNCVMHTDPVHSIS